MSSFYKFLIIFIYTLPPAPKDEKISVVKEKSLEMQMIDSYNAGIEELEKNDVIWRKEI